MNLNRQAKMQKAQKSRDDEEPQSAATLPIEPGGRGPHDSGMETRVTALETDMKDVKAGIGRLEIAQARSEARMEIGFARADARMDTFATALDLSRVAANVSALTERLHAHGQSLDEVKTALRDLASRIDVKMVGGGQMFAIFGGLLGLFFVFSGVLIGLLQHLGLLH